MYNYCVFAYWQCMSRKRKSFEFSLLSMLHELWSGSSKALTSTYFHGVYELSMGEKEVIRGITLYVYACTYVHVCSMLKYFHSMCIYMLYGVSISV